MAIAMIPRWAEITLMIGGGLFYLWLIFQVFAFLAAIVVGLCVRGTYFDDPRNQ